MSSAPKTAAGIRTVHLPPQGREAMLRHRERQVERGLPVGMHDFVFATSRRGGVLSEPALYHGLQREIARLDLPEISFHALRHSYATALLSAGANPKVVQHVLGHPDPTHLLRRYGHVIPGAEAETETETETAAWFAEMLGNPSGSRSGNQQTPGTQKAPKSSRGRGPRKPASPPRKTSKIRVKSTKKPR